MEQKDIIQLIEEADMNHDQLAWMCAYLEAEIDYTTKDIAHMIRDGLPGTINASKKELIEEIALSLDGMEEDEVLERIEEFNTTVE